jgi:hypothetical protein
MWDQLQSAELSFLPSGMLKGRLTRRVGVVRVLGRSGGEQESGGALGGGAGGFRQHAG